MNDIILSEWSKKRCKELIERWKKDDIPWVELGQVFFFNPQLDTEDIDEEMLNELRKIRDSKKQAL